MHDEQKEEPHYPHIAFMGSDTWIRRIPITKEQKKKYHGFRRFCFWALMLLMDRIIAWSNH